MGESKSGTGVRADLIGSGSRSTNSRRISADESHERGDDSIAWNNMWMMMMMMMNWLSGWWNAAELSFIELLIYLFVITHWSPCLVISSTGKRVQAAGLARKSASWIFSCGVSFSPNAQVQIFVSSYFILLEKRRWEIFIKSFECKIKIRKIKPLYWE